MSHSPRNVVILPQDGDGERLSETSKFCLDVALHRDGFIDEIWVLGPKNGPVRTNSSVFAQWNRNATVRDFHLDPKIWPMDVGNNLYLQSPLSVYDALRNHLIPENIYIPLRGAGAFFILQARKAGLIPRAANIITSCYLPRRLEQAGSLILPQNMSGVVDWELEEQCAALSDEIWVGHDVLIDEISKTFGSAQRDKIVTLPLLHPDHPLKPIDKHIVFAGLPLPLYGFDAFCDLAEQLENELESVTVLLRSTADKDAIKWAKSARKRLSGLNVTLKWETADKPVALLGGVESGVFVSLMRTPVFTEEARGALAVGITTLWGTGFDLDLPEIATLGLHAVVSDARKATRALEALWGAKPAGQKPLRLTPSHNTAAKPPKPAPFPSVKLLSVIVTHHNRPNFLKQCLASLANQTDSNFDVVVVDDGSQPNVISEIETIVENSSLESISLTKIENSYPAAARNHGAKLARGDALFFVDDDNILDPRTISALRQAIENHDIALSFFQTFRGDIPEFKSREDGEKLAELIGPAYGFAGLIPGTGIFHNLTGNASVMIRRPAFEALGGFSSKFGIGLEDYAFMLRAAFQKNFAWVVLPEPYLHFRLHDDKIRNTHVDWVSPVRLQAGQWRIFQELGQENASLPIMSLAYARQLHELTQYTYIAGERPKYFRLRSIALHQYLRPFLSKHAKLRRWVVKFTSGESRLAKFLEKWLF